MAMDAKDPRAESALAERSSDGNGKFVHTASALQYERAKSCQEIGSNSYKVDVPGARPCAVIGPDRVAPPARDALLRKAPVEPWLAPDPGYRRPPDYPHKMVEYQDPTRNISPRQTFQENMQRIIMPPGYNANPTKLNEDPAYASKINKINVPVEAKYCDVPYNVNGMSSDQKNIRNTDHSVSNVNPLLVRSVPHGWPAGSVNVRPLRPYGAPEVYQYPDYANCAGTRPPLARPHPAGQEESTQLYPDPYYHEGNVRFKPYPSVKERYPQSRYEYLGNYPNPYHPPHPFATHKYELPKSMPAHPYPGYPQVPLKYTERISEPVMDGYQRSFNQQTNYGVPFRNPVIHPPYRAVPGSSVHSKLHPYSPDGANKPNVSNKLPYDPNNKIHIDYDTSRTKTYAVNDSYYLNEINRSYHGKNPIVLPGYPPTNMHGLNPHPYYTKESIQLKNYEYARLKNMDPHMMNSPLTKLPMQFSPSTLAISPADSNASIDTAQTHGTSHEDCGYVSQTSITSMESLNRYPMEFYGRYDYRYGPIARNLHQPKPDPKCNQEAKSKKDIRQFISSWSEGDEENADNNNARDVVKGISAEIYNSTKQYDSAKTQEQLYVLGLVNVPSEELSKYEHIQKVSKLPENIKGYSSLELLNQFEEAIECSKINGKPPIKREVQIPLKSMDKTVYMHDTLPRAVSPLDVEAKISQSVIHKDVGCNFEIKPCSPKMMNVEVAAPVQTILNERVIEKVANPLSLKSPLVLHTGDENVGNLMDNKVMKCPLANTASSCKMINSQLLSETIPIDNLKTNYSLQDLESNSGVCLASLPRLDNDIELSFPEVNQQFINANKTESVITTSIQKDLPHLDIERSETSALKSNMSAEYDINYQFSPKGEKEFSRLSKYRKLRRNIPDENDSTQAKAQATRVDSVIIKNPDNPRTIEENTDTSCSGTYLNKEVQEFAINLASQAKNSQVMRQTELDNKCLATNRFEEPGNSSLNTFTMHSKTDDLANKIVNATNVTSNKEVDMNCMDLNLTSRDVSNRYLERSALDMPMNLSPQARYSMTDEELRGNKGSEITKHRETNICTKYDRLIAGNPHNAEHAQELHTSASNSHVSLENPQQDVTQELQAENADVLVSDTSITEQHTLVSESSSDLNIESVETAVENLHNSGESVETAVENLHNGGESVETAVENLHNTGESVETAVENLHNTGSKHLNVTDSDKSNGLVFKEYQIESCGIPEIEETGEDNSCFNEKRAANLTSASIVGSQNEFEKNTSIGLPSKQNHYRKQKRLYREHKSDKTEHRTENRRNKTNSKSLTSKLKRSKNKGHKLREKQSSISHSMTVIDDKSKIQTKKSKFKLSVNSRINLAKEPMICDSQVEQLNVSTDDSYIGTHNYFNTKGSKITAASLSEEDNVQVESILAVKGENEFTTQSVLDCTEMSKNSNVKDGELVSVSNENENLNQIPIETNNTTMVLETKVSSLSADSNCDVLPVNDVQQIQSSPLMLNNDIRDDDSLKITSPNKIESSNKIRSQTNTNDSLDNTQIRLIEQLKTTVSSSDSDETLGNTICNKSVDSEYISTDIYELNNKHELLNEKKNVESSSISIEENSINKYERIKEKKIKVGFTMKSHVSKELFSPRFQNLLTYNENIDLITNNILKCAQSELTSQELDTELLDDETELNDHTIDLKSNIDSDSSKTNTRTSNFKDLTDAKELDMEENDACTSDLPNNVQNDLAEELVAKKTDGNLEKNQELDNKTVEIASIQSSQAVNDGVDDDYVSELSTKNVCLSSPTNRFVNEVIEEDIEIKETSRHLTSFKSEPLVTSNSDGEELYKVENDENSDLSPLTTSEGKVINKANDELRDEYVRHEVNQKHSILTQPDAEETYTTTNIENSNKTHEFYNDQSYENSPNVNLDVNNKNTLLRHNFSEKPRFPLKRSLSDSALDAYDGEADESTVKRCFMLPRKRRKGYNNDIDESHLLNIIQSSRRNSISTIYNENNISFCILIDDNCIIEEESYDPEEINFTQLQGNSLNDSNNDSLSIEEKCQQTYDENVASDDCQTEGNEDRPWVEDVGCEEIIETDDIAENIVIGEAATPKDSDSSSYESDDEDMGILGSAVDHTNKVKHIYGDNMCSNDAQLVDALYRTPQMDVNKKLMDRESQVTERNTKCYDSDTLEMLLAEPINNNQHSIPESDLEYECPNSLGPNQDLPGEKEDDVYCEKSSPALVSNFDKLPNAEDVESDNHPTLLFMNSSGNSNVVDSCESSLDNSFCYGQREDNSYTSSSPEVSSTTSEEKSSSILLKISSYKGSRISEVKNLGYDDKRMENSCKFTEKDYLNPNYNGCLSTHRPLLTKAAQKYIPPLRETIPDLKVKLTLPQQSLLKLKKDKLTKEEPKLSSASNMNFNNNVNVKKEIPKKVKPKFEDVLRNIDEVQLKKNKEKNKKCKKVIPKVVIKKTENGSHYASTSSKDPFNPDLTGRKWQPWVFIEKNQFIDRMALKNKSRAVFNHRKKSFVLSERFCKYKSISSAKFIISQPKLNSFSTGNLKYTIKLKHSY